MDRLHGIGARQRQHVPVAFQGQVVPAETFAAVVVLGETEGLLHGARSAVEQQDSVFQGLGESGIHARRSQSRCGAVCAGAGIECIPVDTPTVKAERYPASA